MIDIGISTLADGNMGVSDDTTHPGRLKFFKKQGIDQALAVSVKQVHSRTVAAANGPFSAPPEADGIVTGNPALVLCVTVADCLPVFLYDRKERGFGIVHSGWKGTGIVLEALRRLGDHCGVLPKDVTARIGPGIGPCCYAVDGDRAQWFRREWGGSSVLSLNGRYYLDLPGINYNLLAGAGVGKILRDGVCTCCGGNYGSFRREGSGRFTRMIAFIRHLL